MKTLKGSVAAITGADAWLIDKMQRLLPLGYQILLETFVKRAMSHRRAKIDKMTQSRK